MDHALLVEKVKPSIALVFVLNGKGEVTSKGSGFVYIRGDILVTCNHVVEVKDISDIKVKFPEYDEFIDAKVVIRDEEHDLALLKLTNTNPGGRPLVRASEDKIKEGMPVVFSGFPLSLTNLTTHQGILSAIIKDVTGVTIYLIDGTVNAGNSGCPLMTSEGQVIGVVNAKRRENSDILRRVEEMRVGAISLYDTDLVSVFNALVNNVQLGIGYAIPCSYIPNYHDNSSSVVDLKKEREKKK